MILMNYDLEMERVINEIRELKAKRVCIQLPDGLKTKSNIIKDQIEKETAANVIIWLGSCFGACDIPEEISKLNIDLLVQWGHNQEFKMGQQGDGK